MSPGTETVPLEHYAESGEAASLGERLASSARYVMTTEVHAYAFAIAANVLLAFIPFAVLLLSVCKHVLHWKAAYDAAETMFRIALPSNQDFIGRIIRNLAVLTDSRKAQLLSLGMLLFSSTGVMLPLEIALNRVWGFHKNRSYLMNQVVSLVLAFVCGVLALLSIMLTTLNLNAVGASVGRLGWPSVDQAFTFAVVKAVTVPASVMILFLIYYVMPHGKVPARPVALAALLAGIAIEIAGSIFVRLLPWLDFPEVYGPFYVSVTVLIWAFLSSLILLAGAQFAAGSRKTVV